MKKIMLTLTIMVFSTVCFTQKGTAYIKKGEAEQTIETTGGTAIKSNKKCLESVRAEQTIETTGGTAPGAPNGEGGISGKFPVVESSVGESFDMYNDQAKQVMSNQAEQCEQVYIEATSKSKSEKKMDTTVGVGFIRGASRVQGQIDKDKVKSFYVYEKCFELLNQCYDKAEQTISYHGVLASKPAAVPAIAAAHTERAEKKDDLKKFCDEEIKFYVDQANKEIEAILDTERQTRIWKAQAGSKRGKGSFGNIGSWIKDNPVKTALGVGAAGLGAYLIFKNKRNKKKEGQKNAENAEGAESEDGEENGGEDDPDSKTTDSMTSEEMFKHCKEDSNKNTLQCLTFVMKTCTPSNSEVTKSCTEYNKNFCGDYSQWSTSGTKGPGFQHQTQYCTLMHAREYCSSGGPANAPSCQWLTKANQVEQCRQNPLSGLCLPSYYTHQVFVAACNGHTKDPICHNALNGQNRFIVSYASTRNGLPGSTLSNAITTGMDDMSFSVNGGLFGVSATRELCNQGQLYDCR